MAGRLVGDPLRPRAVELFLVVPHSGTGQLTGIRGTGSLVIDDDGTHRINLDYNFA